MAASTPKFGYSISTRAEVWEDELADDQDRLYLLDGINNGFKISDLKEADYVHVKQVECENHKSTARYKQLVEKELLKQIENGNYVVINEPALVTSALGAIPKDDSNEVRLIHDGSRPVGEAMNDYSALYPVRYQTLEEAYSLAKPNYYMAKVDLKSAYRSVPIHPSDYCLTGLKWRFSSSDKPTYLFDSRLPFGSRNACSIFHRLTQAVKRCMQRRGFQNIVVYLDDFLIISDSYDECLRAQHELIKLLGKLGFLVSWKKVLGPTKKLPFLGIIIDTSKCTLSLDQTKVATLKSKLHYFNSKSRANKRQLQSLAGSLNWACQAVRGGRFFLRRILDLMNKLKAPNHKAKISDAFKKDILWWLKYLDSFNGVIYYRIADNKYAIHADACDNGGGAFCNGDWYYVNWKLDLDAAHTRLHINYKEILAIVMGINRWAHMWSNSDVTVFTDNVVAKAVINRGHCRSPLVMNHLRNMFWLTAKYNFKLHAVHIPGILNCLPDTISRLHDPSHASSLISLLKNWSHKSYYVIDWKNHMSPRVLRTLSPHLAQPFIN